MTKDKFQIKPAHLALIGLTILTLGILIPSFFIAPFSAIGFAIVIGSLILLSAYAFFAVNTIRSSGKKAVKWLLLPVILGLLIAGGLYANNQYKQYLADKIYAVGDTVEIDNFSFKVTKISEEALATIVKNTSGLAIVDCNTLQYRDGCETNNEQKEQAKRYIADYSRVTIKYEVAAHSTVKGKDLQIKILLDNGRKVRLNVDTSKGWWDDDYHFLYELEDRITVNPASDFGGDLNKGLTRQGTIGVDLQKTEHIIDVVVKYHNQSRTIRINRQ